MDANIHGLRHLLDYARARPTAADPLGGLPLLLEQRDLRRPGARGDPHARDYRGNVSCTGPRACYDESKRYGETLCVNFAQRVRRPRADRAPVQQLRPGAEDQRPARDARLRARRAGRPRHRACSPTASATRTFCYATDAITGYYKVLVRGRPGEPYNIGTETPEISMRELAEQIAAVARDAIRLPGEA